MRVKRGNVSRKKHKKILKQTKGFYGGLSKLIRPAMQVLPHALRNATQHRRLKKRDFKNLWVVRLNAAVRQEGMSYSKFMGLKNKQQIALNTKILSELAIEEPAVFKEIAAKVSN